MIWDVHPRIRIQIFSPSWIPDPGPEVKKSPDPGSRICNTAFRAKAFSFSTTGTGIVLTEFVAFRGVNFTVNNVELVVQSNVVVLAVKPHLYHQVHHPVPPSYPFLSFPIPSFPIPYHSIPSLPFPPFPSHHIPFNLYHHVNHPFPSCPIAFHPICRPRIPLCRKMQGSNPGRFLRFSHLMPDALTTPLDLFHISLDFLCTWELPI